MNSEYEILRRLAWRYARLASHPHNAQTMALHRAVNDLSMLRPVVLIDELPWHELNFDGSLTLQCSTPVLRDAERWLRKQLFHYQYFPADMILSPYFPVQKIIHSTGIGIKVQEQCLHTNQHNNISSHEYTDQLATQQAVAALHPPILTYDREVTMAHFVCIAEVIGDILPVRVIGHDCYTSPWDEISEYRGVTNLLIDLADDPEHSHRVAKAIFGFEESRLAQMERLGLLEAEPYTLHCTSALCSELPGNAGDGGPVLRSQVWGRSMAQIFASVGNAMHEEFDIQYMKRLMEPFALVYYGCCEPLDKKMDLVKQIPHLRKIGVTPWADVDVATEAIGKNYVVANKPNPAAVALTLDEDALRKEIGHTLAAVKRNGCSCDIVLKDISTANNKLENLIRWEQIVMEMVHGW